MALGDKHATLSFSGWPWAPDARKRGILETPVAPRHGEIIFFCEPRASNSRKPRPFDSHIVPEARKGGPELVQKTTKNRTRTQKTQTFADLALKLDFECLLNGVSTPTVPGICANMS